MIIVALSERFSERQVRWCHRRAYTSGKEIFTLGFGRSCVRNAIEACPTQWYYQIRTIDNTLPLSTSVYRTL